MKKITYFFLFTILYSCADKDLKFENFADVKDSIDFYFDKVDNSNLPDSIKSINNGKAYTLIKKIKNDSLRFKYTFKSGARFYNLKSFNEYKKLSNQVIYDAINSKDTLIEAKGYIYLGDYYIMKSNYDSAFFYYDKAEIKYVSIGNTSKINEARINKSAIQYFKQDYIGCETTILRALPILTKEGNNELLYNSFNTLGLCRIETNEFDEALEYFNKSLKYVDVLIEKSGAKEITLNSIGYTYLKKKEYKKANEYFEKVLAGKNAVIFKKIYSNAKLNLAYSNFKLGDYLNFEQNLGDVIKNYNELNISTIQPYVYLSEYYEVQNNIMKAQEKALQAYNISQKENLYRDKLIALKQLTNVFPEKSKYYTDKYIQLSDSIAAVDKKVQNTFARIEYRVDELNNENLLLAERNKQIIYYSIIGILLLSLFYLYNWQKQKQKELFLVKEQKYANEQVYNLMIDQQVQMDNVKEQEQRRISQELHDGVLGKLFGARMNLEILNDKYSDAHLKIEKKKYLNEIIEAESQIRSISHELNDEKIAIIDNFQLLIDKFIENQESLLSFKVDYNKNTKIPWVKFSAEAKINIYRIIQETFVNIIKYSKAKSVSLDLFYTKGILNITIKDNGIGFNLKRASKGIGLKNMKERALSINATYTVESEINKGTKTQLILEKKPKTKQN